MFGVNFIHSSSELAPPPKDVPPPTPIRLPRCSPQLDESSDQDVQTSLVRYLQRLQRPTELRESHFAALGVHLHSDVPAEEIVPIPSYLPSSIGWDGISMDEAYSRDATFRYPMSNGGRSPDARAYLDRRNELSIPNQDAFRTIRRIKPEAGKQQRRLGNSYEFFKQMEIMAAYWDDTSLPPLPAETQEQSPPLPPRPTEADAGAEQPATGAAPESNARSEADPESESQGPQQVTYRTSVGAQMPPDFRHNFISAFVKLVSYGFGCNIFPPRVEPRLQLLSPPTKKSSKSKAPPNQVASYFPSGCVYLAKAPTTREAARAGVTEGPIAAVSARNTTNFKSSAESNIDFGRELIAALIIAQHRAREGQPEKRYGEGKWWATEKRWGGGEGGPIGREVDGDSIVGDKDAVESDAERPSSSSTPQNQPEEKAGSSSSLSLTKGGKASLPSIPMRGQPASKKPRKNMSIYDSYRMVRPPSTNWDRKAIYKAVGRPRGADYDDVFVLSSVFHHFSILRVRVPNQLLKVFAGEAEDVVETDGKKGRSWGKLEIWRSKWFDLFVVEDRLEAMRLLWGVIGYSMRKDEEPEGDGSGDVPMKNA
ncbi:uncharacterized protein F4822DRAFT_412459 [Hypoxylon trugodes]|uniref:uncharacterized protein n=1 Tax=Hypoxylon trugodes TaxID=326681 RepID=UPI00219E6991|nr:uncharacterized protein F4822DRAFT_412459 [Hypoxylon trugodes]KAI1385227.1 hypothetical protein F4822DRAFT_412459 [Hypoxylon trugodes]